MKLRFRPGVRLLTVLIVFLLCSGVIGGRLVQVQGLDSARFAALAADQRERRVVLPPQRGSILDRDGGELAMSVDMQTIVANPRFIPEGPQRDAAVASLATALGADPASVREKLAKLEQFYGHIGGCHVVLARPHKHHRHGNLFDHSHCCAGFLSTCGHLRRNDLTLAEFGKQDRRLDSSQPTNDPV